MISHEIENFYKSKKSEIVEEIWNGNKINETTNNERDDFSQSPISKANQLELKLKMELVDNFTSLKFASKRHCH